MIVKDALSRQVSLVPGDRVLYATGIGFQEAEVISVKVEEFELGKHQVIRFRRVNGTGGNFVIWNWIKKDAGNN